MTDSLKPLEYSWKVDAAEDELQRLFIDVFEDMLKEQCDEINCYGAPHLGNLDLIARHVTADGLSLLNNSDETKMRYIFKAWRYRNPERGLHMLRTYARVVFGSFQVVNQLWQKKGYQYTEYLRTLEQINDPFSGEELGDFFLTSRVRVDLDTDAVPSNIINALRTVVAARIVLELRISKYLLNTIGIAQVCGIHGLIYAKGTAGRFTQFLNGEWSLDGSENLDGILHGNALNYESGGFLSFDGNSITVSSGDFIAVDTLSITVV